MDYKQLQERYTDFNYESYEYEVEGDVLRLTFRYRLIGDEVIPFTHRVTYAGVGNVHFDPTNVDQLENFVFHIGMVETINYWKLACAKNLNVMCGALNEDQVAWWKKLYFHGLGEFIYLNGMAEMVTEDNFVTITSADGPTFYDSPLEMGDTKGNLIPVGGGKDSVVTLEVLRDSAVDNVPFVMSPPQAAYDCIEVAGYKGYLEAKRVFDKRMIEMNGQGYLNGHVPFSAILAFIATLGAAFLGKRYIPLSNEKSANEPSVIGTTFNHQYSKSFEFEEDFSRYNHRHLSEAIDYFSLLRPLYEIEIGEMFSHYEAYHQVYRSCNRGKKTNEWCGECPKCLFVQTILTPYIEKKALIDQYGKDLLDDIKLKPIFDELIGMAETKPFECVGTIWEVRRALNMAIKQEKTGALLDYYIGINGTELADEPTEYEEGDLLPEEHRLILEREMRNLEG